MTNLLSRRINIKYLLLGLSNAISFNFIGLVIIAEIIICLQVIMFFAKGKKTQQNKESRMIRNILILGTIWFTTQLFTDLYQESEITDTLKSLSQIFVFTMLLTAMITHFQHKEYALHNYLIGFCLSNLLIFVGAWNTGNAQDWWKFYFGPTVSVLALVSIGSLRANSMVKFLAIISLAAISIFLGSRSLGVILILTSIGFLTFRSSRSIARSLIFIIVLLVLGNVFNSLIRDASLSGKFGVAQQVKAQQQYTNGPILLVARSELLYELASIRESSFWGKGSNPIPSANVLISTHDMETEFRINSKQTSAYENFTTTGRTPQHSMLFGAWLEGGVLSILLLSYLFILMVKWNIRNNIKGSTSKLSILARYFFINFIWAFFFSPLGAGSRMTIAVGFGICYFAYTENTRKESAINV